MADLNALDQIKAGLEERFPGWQIWYVPHGDRTVVWCARPWPLLNASSEKELADEILIAHQEPPEGALALAQMEEYLQRREQLRQHQEKAAEA